MGKIFDVIDEQLERWIFRQSMFFVGSAPLDADGHVNVSPKGPIDSLKVLTPTSVAYLDLIGSGAETIAHVRENGRIVIMLCAFEGPPRIVRLHGRGEVVVASDERFEELMEMCGFTEPATPEARRAIVLVEVDRIADSCGYGVPLMKHEGNRPHMELWAAKKVRVGGPEALLEYQREKNARSIDGLPAVDVPTHGARVTAVLAVFDGHNDALTSDDHALLAEGRPGGHLDLPRMRAGGVRGAIFAVFTESAGRSVEHVRVPRDDGVLEFEPAPPVEHPVAAAARERGRRAAARARTRRAGAGCPVRRAISIALRDDEAGPPAAVLHLEGAEAIDPGLEALDLWYAAGLRSVGPVWSRPNAFAHGVPFISPSSPDTGPGLTDAGRALVPALRRARDHDRRQPSERGGLLGRGQDRRGPDRGHPLGRARAVPDLAQPVGLAARRDRGVGRTGRDRVRGRRSCGRTSPMTPTRRCR